MTQSALVTALAILVVGLIVAVAVRVVVNRLLARLLPDTEQNRRLRRSGVRGVFAFLLIATLIAVLGVLAPDLLSGIPAQLVAFLPRLAIALLLLWLGAAAAGLLRTVVEASLERLGASGAAVLAKAVYWVVLGLAIVMAADQLGIQTAALQRLLFIAVIAAGAALAFSVGAGGTRLAGNVIAGRYVDDRFQVGERIEVEEYRGEVVELGVASLTLAEDDGSLVEIPHSYLLVRPVRRSGPNGDY